MTFKFIEPIGELINILEEHTLSQVFKQNPMIGKIWQNPFSKIIGISAVNIQILNIEEPFMGLTCQVYTQLNVLLTKFLNINGSLRRHPIKNPQVPVPVKMREKIKIQKDQETKDKIKNKENNQVVQAQVNRKEKDEIKLINDLYINLHINLLHIIKNLNKICLIIKIY
jgi:hypothetical protein